MIKIYTLALGLWLGFSTQAWAIVFVFKEESSTEPSANLSIAVQLSENEDFKVQVVSFDESLFNIQADGVFQRLDFSYSFFGNAADVTVTPTVFTNDVIVDLDQVLFEPNRLFHATRSISLTGFSSSDFLGIWTFEMGVDDEFTPRPVFTGRFVAVPEPAPILLIAIGLIGLLTLPRVPRLTPPATRRESGAY